LLLCINSKIRPPIIHATRSLLRQSACFSELFFWWLAHAALTIRTHGVTFVACHRQRGVGIPYYPEDTREETLFLSLDCSRRYE
jgi:hypothetical protein